MDCFIRNCKRYHITSLLQIDCLQTFQDKGLLPVMNSNEVDAWWWLSLNGSICIPNLKTLIWLTGHREDKIFIVRKKIVFIFNTSDMSINSSVHLNCLKFCIYVNKDANLNWHINIIKTGIDSTGSRHDMIFCKLFTPQTFV